jgi:putative phage-type endonuclease
MTAHDDAERITGWTEDTPMNSDMWRGVESEPFAREVYSDNYGEVTEVGFMRRDEDGWTLGYSPDGLVGDDGLIEIKAPRAKTHLRTILADEVPAHYMAQCQAGLLVTGRKWIDFVSYVGGMPLYVKRVEPDPAWFAVITARASPSRPTPRRSSPTTRSESPTCPRPNASTSTSRWPDMSFDIGDTLAPNSDQLDAIDLIGGPRRSRSRRSPRARTSSP